MFTIIQLVAFIILLGQAWSIDPQVVAATCSSAATVTTTSTVTPKVTKTTTTTYTPTVTSTSTSTVTPGLPAGFTPVQSSNPRLIFDPQPNDKKRNAAPMSIEPQAASKSTSSTPTSSCTRKTTTITTTASAHTTGTTTTTLTKTASTTKTTTTTTTFTQDPACPTSNFANLGYYPQFGENLLSVDDTQPALQQIGTTRSAYDCCSLAIRGAPALFQRGVDVWGFRASTGFCGVIYAVPPGGGPDCPGPQSRDTNYTTIMGGAAIDLVVGNGLCGEWTMEVS